MELNLPSCSHPYIAWLRTFWSYQALTCVHIGACMYAHEGTCIHLSVWEGVSSGLHAFPHPRYLPLTSLLSFPLSLSPPLFLSFDGFSCLFLSLVPAHSFGLFPPLFSMWIFLLFSLLFRLFPPYPCLHTDSHTHPSLPVFSQAPGP